MSREHRFKDEITCPYCNFQFSDSWEFHETEFPLHPIDIKCDECGEKFKAVVNCEVTYCSFEKEGSDG